MDEVSFGVGDDLEFDVMGIENEFLDVAVSVSEAGDGFLGGLVIHVDEFGFFHDGTHAASTSTGGGFDHDGEADAFGDFESVLCVFEDAF